ncbi:MULTISPECIES: hypothetical protein [unclassified Streptomyces]|uniref:hypothetical protein n=1 Tax=unclassified Streptomyces TaxID=2593676 RepID=UPI0016516227|nr:MULTISPECIES: hypothetical protein [unclassified Streptomyces]
MTPRRVPPPRLRAAAALTVALLGGTAAPAVAGDGFITVLDNSHADSILEVDRAANVQQGSGTAGSDHEGSAVDMVEALVAAHRREEGVEDDG